MTLHDRFVQVMGHIDAERQELILTPTGTDKRPDSSKNAKTIRHDLKSVRVSTIDSKNQRLVCQAKRHFGLYVISKHNYRILYFLTHEEMLAAMDLLIRVGQKFEHRADQHEVYGAQPDTENTVLDHQIVRHRVTREKFLKKVIPHDAPDYIAYQGYSELQIL